MTVAYKEFPTSVPFIEQLMKSGHDRQLGSPQFTTCHAYCDRSLPSCRARHETVGGCVLPDRLKHFLLFKVIRQPCISPWRHRLDVRADLILNVYDILVDSVSSAAVTALLELKPGDMPVHSTKPNIYSS